MTEYRGTRNLVSRTQRDPWTVLLASRPGRYQIPEIGRTLIELVDVALFERNLDRAISNAVIFRKWAESDLHFQCQAPAVLGAVYSVCRMEAEAEKRFAEAERLIAKRDCVDCKAQYLKRLGTFHYHGYRYDDAYQSYKHAAEAYLAAGNKIEAGKSLAGRSVARYMLSEHEEAIGDSQHALELLGDSFSVDVIMTTANIAAMHSLRGRADLATDEINKVQNMIKGRPSMERPRLILRWIKALVLESQNALKLAGEMLERVESRMRRLDMTPELKALLADRARIARRPDVVRRIARKAHAIEDVPRVLRAIEAVIQQPTLENIAAWRNTLNSCVSPFPATTN